MKVSAKHLEKWILAIHRGSDKQLDFSDVTEQMLAVIGVPSVVTLPVREPPAKLTEAKLEAWVLAEMERTDQQLAGSLAVATPFDGDIGTLPDDSEIDRGIRAWMQDYFVRARTDDDQTFDLSEVLADAARAVSAQRGRSCDD